MFDEIPYLYPAGKTYASHMLYNTGSQTVGRDPNVGRGHIFMGPFILLVLMQNVPIHFGFNYYFKTFSKNIPKNNNKKT